MHIPLSTSFTLRKGNKQHIYDSTVAYMLLPGHTFDYSAKNKSHFIVSNFFVDSISTYSNKLLQSNYQGLLSMNPDISLLSQEGSVLLRAVAQVWSVLNNKTSSSAIILKELEDDLLASLVLYSNTDTNIIKSYPYKDEKYRLNRTVEYINENLKNPITRDDLAEISGRSIRTRV